MIPDVLGIAGQNDEMKTTVFADVIRDADAGWVIDIAFVRAEDAMTGRSVNVKHLLSEDDLDALRSQAREEYDAQISKLAEDRAESNAEILD